MQTGRPTRSPHPLIRRLGGLLGFALVLIGLNVGLYRVIPEPQKVTINYSFAGRLRMNELVNGVGWELPEQFDSGISMIWTNAPTATVNFFLYIKADLKLQLLVGSAMPGVVDTLKISVNNTPVAITRQETPLGSLFEGVVPRHLVGLGRQQVVLTLQTGPTVSPASFDSLSADTRRLGIAVRALSLEPTTNAALTDFDGKERGRGWQRPETGQNRMTFQWMGSPEASVQLPPMDATDVAVAFHVSDAISDEVLNSLTLWVNDRSLPLARIPAAGVDGTIFQALIPRLALGSERGPVSPWLTFRIARTASLKQLGSGSDDRPLGLAFDWLLTYPAQDAWLGMALIPWGTGWGGLERDSGGDRFRWMNVPNAELNVPVVPNQATRLQFDAVYTITPETVKSLRVSANGVPLALSAETLEEGTVFTTTIPPLPSDNARLTFTIDRTASPAEFGGSDDRQLGIALKWLSFEPAD